MKNHPACPRVTGSLSTRIGFVLSIGVLLTSWQISAKAQNPGKPTDGGTPLSLEAGSPAGAYSLAGFDTINLYNGSLNFALPLLSVGGRGGAHHTMVLNLQRQWMVEKYTDSQENLWEYPIDNREEQIRPGYGPGTMAVRRSGTGVIACEWHNPSIHYDIDQRYQFTQTTLSFTGPDGTEILFRDVQHGGLSAIAQQCGSHNPDFEDGYNRGKVWTSIDGSHITFVAANNIRDALLAPMSTPEDYSVSGFMYFPDGTVYEIGAGVVSGIHDRNGNWISFDYDTNGVTTITDSLNRQVTVQYNYNEGGQYGVCDRITYKGFGGASRVIRISKSSLTNVLRSEYSLTTLGYLFPGLDGGTTYYNPTVVSDVWLPDSDSVTRRYQIRYNNYGEVARVVLPTGGAFEYDWTAGMSDGDASGVKNSYPNYGIYRRVVERRVYDAGGSGSSYTNRATYSRPESQDGTVNLGYVTVQQLDINDTLLASSKHYFLGPGGSSAGKPVGSNLLNGRESQTDVFDLNGSTVLNRVVNTWVLGDGLAANPDAPTNPRVTETVSTLEPSGANLVSKQTFDYDQYNNQTDVYEYGFGSGSAGSLVRRTHTNYLTTQNGYDYACDPSSTCGTSADASTIIHLRSLPTQISVYDSGNTERARSSFEYDNYATDTNHAGLVGRSYISGHLSGFTTGYVSRGNATATTHYLLNSSGTVTGSISAYAQYDIAGNVVKAIDARGNPTTIDFTDCFGAPNGNAQTPSAPSELSTPGLYSYALATKVTNALSQSAFVQFDYYLGKPVDAEDANGIVASGYYDDVLDRPTQVRRAVNVSGLQSQTTFIYDDTNHYITTTSDLNSNNDNSLVSSAFYDNLGRTYESRQYEPGGNYIATKRDYDALGRAYRVSNPYRPWQSESALWTTNAYDALGRTVTTTSPDSAVVTTSYAGNTVTATDQAGKSRKSVSDALGRLTSVYEDPGSLNYQTSYTYDVLNNLTQVTQGDQTRTFVYDSLKRLTSATNPESGTSAVDAYDYNGNVLVATDARGVSTHISYDELNRPTRRWFNGSNSTSYTTNNSPALPSGVSASNEVKYFYDSQTLPSGAPSTSSPDYYSRGYSTGRLVAVTYGSSSSAGDYYGFDALGRPVMKIQQTGSVNYKTGATYDLAGAPLTEIYPSGHTVTNAYDSAHRTTGVTGYLGDGTLRTYSTGITYAPSGQMTQEQFGTTTAIYNKLTYNSRGQLAEMRASTAGSDTSWDRGKIVNDYSTQCSGASCNGTDNNGNLKKQAVFIPSSDTFAQSYDYDSLNRLQWVHETKNGGSINWKQQYSYDRYGNRTIAQGSTETYGAGIPKPYFSVDPSTNRLTVPNGYTGTMSYDSAGNLTTDTYSAAAVTRAYDAENRMTKETQAGSYDAGTYTYDGDGRRVKRKAGSAETWQVYGLGGELVAEYAQNGAASTPQKEYGYRNGQLLVTVTCGSGWGDPPTLHDNPLVVGETTVQARHITELRTAIDALRAREGMAAYPWTTSATTNDYINANPIIEMRTALDQALGVPPSGYSAGLAQNQPIKAVHIQELRDRLVAAWGIDIRWLVTDQLGTPRMVFDQSGSLSGVSRHDYLPFGEDLFAGTGGRTTSQGYSVGDGARQKFTLKERDIETGLDYFLARYYSSTQGRFTSPDPIFISEKQIANPQSWNLYGYVNNDPLAYLDPTGMERVKLGRHSDEEIDRKRKEKEDQIKQGKKDGTLTKPEEKKLKAERNTLALEKEGNKLARSLIDRLPASERVGLQVSDFTLTTDPTGADFMSDSTFVNNTGDPQGLANAAGKKAMFLFRGYSTEIFINTTTNNIKDMMSGDRDWITFGATTVKHEQSHRDKLYNEFQAYSEQKRVLEQFGPGAFSSAEVYRGHLDFVNRNIEQNRPKP